MTYIKKAPLFSLFWENSKINNRTIFKLAQSLNEDARTVHNIPQLIYPTEDLVLVMPKDELSQVMRKRESARFFSNRPITEKQLGSLFFAFSQKINNQRVVPSAGAKYPIETYAFLFNVKSKLKGNIVYYNSDKHSLSIVSKCPPWSEIKDVFGLELSNSPAVLFIFAAIANRTIDKYRERGGRFILIEAGIYAQNLSLRLIQENLGGVISGALKDDEVRKYLRLDNQDVLITLGFACGCI